MPSKRSDDSGVETYALAKRLEALDLVEVSGDAKVVKRTFQMGRYPNLGDTWHSFEPEQAGWTPDTIKGFARYAYANMVAQGASPWTVVSALWIPGKGCYIGSLPKEQVKFASMAPIIAPTLWEQIKNRRVTVPGAFATYHAEDMACFNYERWVGRNVNPHGQYPANSRIYSYGLTRDMTRAGPIGACKEPNTGIRPSCEDTMHYLNVGV